MAISCDRRTWNKAKVNREISEEGEQKERKKETQRDKVNWSLKKFHELTAEYYNKMIIKKIESIWHAWKWIKNDNNALTQI